MNLSIIMVRPQMGENIGAAARIMANFGFEDLRIINPRDGWPSEKAIEMATDKAAYILENAKIFHNLSDAMNDIEVAYALTARIRDMNKEMIILPEIQGDMIKEKNYNIALIFGPENSGLNNNEVTLANKIINIPTNSNCSSINLAQAIAIICYEFSKIFGNNKFENFEKCTSANAYSTRHDINNFVNFLVNLLEKTYFFGDENKKSRMILNIKNIFTKNKYFSQDISTLYGIIKALSVRKE